MPQYNTAEQGKYTEQHNGRTDGSELFCRCSFFRTDLTEVSFERDRFFYSFVRTSYAMVRYTDEALDVFQKFVSKMEKLSNNRSLIRGLTYNRADILLIPTQLTN